MNRRSTAVNFRQRQDDAADSAAAAGSIGDVTIGVLALQGAFEEHQHCLESVGCRTVQVRTPAELTNLDGIVLPGGESTAMGLIGTHCPGMWDALQSYVASGKPTWGTCAGLVLLAERCVGTSAVIENGQSLIGGVDVLVCRNYFGSQISSFEMATPCPPPGGGNAGDGYDGADYPGVFIRAPAILTAGEDVTVLGKVVATPCRQAAVVLRELERKIDAGEDVVNMGVVDALERGKSSPRDVHYKEVRKEGGAAVAAAALGAGARVDDDDPQEEKKEMSLIEEQPKIELPGAADGTNAREVICAVRKGNVLCTAFHPELTNDYRWHSYFVGMVRESRLEEQTSSS